jgi:endonuclease III
MRQDQITAALRIVKREIRQWEEPVLGVVSRESNRDPFRILISCLLSLRTKDKTTSEASARLYALAHQPAAMLALPLKKIERAIYPVGFYRTKAKSIHAICRRLLDVYGGAVPDSVEELVTLSGVGRKTGELGRDGRLWQARYLRGYSRASHQQSLGLREDKDTGGN